MGWFLPCLIALFRSRTDMMLSTVFFFTVKGGMPGSARLRDCEILQKITSNQAEAKRLYGAICAAPAVTLLPWGLLRKKQVLKLGLVV